MEPRNRAKGLPKENQRDGFGGKEPALDRILSTKQAVRLAIREEVKIFQELVGKEVLIDWHSQGAVLAKLETAGKSFLKLVDVLHASVYPGPGEYKRTIAAMKAGETPCLEKCPSLVLNKTEIDSIVPVSDYE